jgi:hypothetical protein
MSLESRVYFEEMNETTESEVPKIQAGFTFYSMST